MTLEFQKAKDLIERSQNVLLTMHERMDGDDGGSVLALARHLEQAGKNAACVIKGGVPPALAFLPGSQKVLADVRDKNFDLLITCGCSDLSRTGLEKIVNLGSQILPARQSSSDGRNLQIINIDHHPDNTLFGTVNLVDAKKSSVAELVYDFFKWAKWPIDKDIATCLLTGIITDTGSFMHSNTTVSTLQAAAELMGKGAQSSKITQQTFRNKAPKVLKAWGKAMENSFYDAKHKIIYSVMTEADLKQLGDLPPAAFEGFVETLNTVPEAKFALFLRQDGNIIKGSLRSDPFKNVDVAKIAKLFGGGGHKLAAGFSVVGKLEKDEHGKWKVI